VAKFFTDFSTYTDGVQPSDWTERYDTTIGAAVVTATSAPGGVKALRITKTANSSSYAVSWDAVGTPTGDVELLWKVYVTSVGTTFGGADQGIIHGSGAAGTMTGYRSHALAAVSAGAANVQRWTNGTQSSLASGTNSVTAVNTWRWCRTQRVSSTIRARWWSDGSSEPGTWQVSASDANHSTGWVGLNMVHNDTTCWFGQFSVGTGGDSAPMTNPADTTGFFF
jgi:hypothetical protein